jgi:hypothetical protein
VGTGCSVNATSDRAGFLGGSHSAPPIGIALFRSTRRGKLGVLKEFCLLMPDAKCNLSPNGRSSASARPLFVPSEAETDGQHGDDCQVADRSRDGPELEIQRPAWYLQPTLP